MWVWSALHDYVITERHRGAVGWLFNSGQSPVLIILNTSTCEDVLQIVGYSPSLVDQIWVADDLTQVLRHFVLQVLKVLTEVVKI